MKNEQINNALNAIEKELEKDLNDIHNKSSQELDEMIDDYSETVEKLNKLTNNSNDQLVDCVNLIKELEKIADAKRFDLLPERERIDTCIKYLQSINAGDMICSICYSLGDLLFNMGDNTKNTACYKLALMYYCLGITELEKILDEKPMLYYEIYGTLLSSAAVLFNMLKIKVSFDVSYVKKGYTYARKYKNKKLADNLANNYIIIYQKSGEIKHKAEIEALVKSYKKHWFI